MKIGDKVKLISREMCGFEIIVGGQFNGIEEAEKDGKIKINIGEEFIVESLIGNVSCKLKGIYYYHPQEKFKVIS